MSEGRVNLLPDEKLVQIRPVIATRLKAVAEMVTEGAFDEFFDEPMRKLLQESLHCTGAHEGTVWLLDYSRRFLVPRYNTGPNAASFVGSFRQTLRAGMISMVAVTEQPVCENGMTASAQQDRTLDKKLGLQTCAMLAIPFYFVGELRGVISAVQLRPAADSATELPGFTPQHVNTFQQTASILTRLIEHGLMTLSLGIEAA